MDIVKPFRALRYNPAKAALERVIAPPYDVISPKDQQYYHERSQYNLIHILLGNDIEGEDKYQRGADYVILPRFLGGQELARLISEDSNFSSLKELKKRDLRLIGTG